MKTSKLHTLRSILEEGIWIDGQDTPVEISCICIPKIQRAYAQGRNKENDVRKDFLDALFNVLTSEENKTIELSFLFGSKQIVARRSAEGFELLDGQQRTTTLFLLYWYVSMKEEKGIPDFLSKFTYETRDTSTQFLSYITDTKSGISIKDTIPSNAIKYHKWFTDEFYCDPTVCSMLTMLDSIDVLYRQKECNNLYNKLERLKFYVLMLEKFDMNDELYIKMNSRGLSLIPFENFKASLVQYMKSKERKSLYGTDEVEDGEPPFWFNFITKMDASWIDIFWQYTLSNKEGECNDVIEINDHLIGVKYFNFINRYFFTKAVLSDTLSNQKINELTSFFYKDAESDKMEQRLFGWENYELIFQQNESSGKVEDTLFYKLQKVLDTIHEYKDYIENRIQSDPFGRTSNFKIDADKFNNLHERVVFAAITEFIEHIPNGKKISDEDIEMNFLRMLRVTFNIIENTIIESPEVAASVIKIFGSLNSAPNAITGNFYQVLANTNIRSYNEQLQEEILKAKEMYTSDGTFLPEWEQAFIEAEHHPFFKGSILFFFSEKSGSSSDFIARYNIVKDMFDKDGITIQYRDNHLLLRALLSQFNSWNKIKGRCITENSEKEKYLKNGIIRKPETRQLICKYFDSNCVQTSIKDYLVNQTDQASPLPNESLEFELLFNRLIKDNSSVALLDWVAERELDKKKHFFVQENRKAKVINIPGTWYDRMVLDTERHLIIPSLIEKYTMEYDDINQKKMIDSPIKDSFGWDISIKKQIEIDDETFTLVLTFNTWKWVDFYIYGKDTDLLAKKFSIPVERKHKEYVQTYSVEYKMFENMECIEEKIDNIIEKLKEKE